MIAWLGRLAQAPVLRRVVCEEMLQPVSAAAAMQAASLEATAGLPPEAAAVARMLNQQREGLLQSLEAALPVPGNGAGPGRPLPLPAQGRQLSLLYWQLSTLLPLDGQLVEVRARCAAGGVCWGNRAPACRRALHRSPFHHADACIPLHVQELATLHILLLYSTPFKEHFGLALLCFYPHIGGESPARRPLRLLCLPAKTLKCSALLRVRQPAAPSLV